MFMTEAGQRGNRWASLVWMTVLGSMKWASPTFRKALALLPGSLFFFQNSLSLATQSFSSSEKIKEKQKKTRPLISFLFTSTWIFFIWSLVFSLIWNGYKLTLGGCSMSRKKFGSKNKTKQNKFRFVGEVWRGTGHCQWRASYYCYYTTTATTTIWDPLAVRFSVWHFWHGQGKTTL